MLKKKVVVKNPAGLHTRPSSMLVQVASQFESDFHIHMYGYRINAKSILGVMTLAAEYGAELELELDGPDEKKAMQAITRLFENGFQDNKGKGGKP
jgi:phosphocarrier protein HPr